MNRVTIELNKKRAGFCLTLYSMTMLTLRPKTNLRIVYVSFAAVERVSRANELFLIY